MRYNVTTHARLEQILPFARVEWNPLGREYIAWLFGAGESLGATPIKEAKAIAAAYDSEYGHAECAHCGYPLNAAGKCTAPLSVAD
jgi:hypothetical protein